MKSISKIISSNELGIGNRIKCLVSAMLASKQLKVPLAIYWPLNEYCKCSLNDIIINKFELLNYEEFNRVKKLNNVKVINTWRLMELKSADNDYINLDSEEFTTIYKPNEIGYIDFKYHDIPLEKKVKFTAVFDQLIFNNEIENRVNSIKNEVYNLKTALCIRTWHEASDRTILFNPANIERIIQSSKTKIFISCDSEHYMEELIHKYSEKIIYYHKRTKNGDRQSIIGMQDILVDMKLISLCKYIYVPYISTFPEIAWWLGGCNAEIIPIESPEQIEYYNLASNSKYIKAEIDCIQNGQKSFIYYFKIIIRKLIRKFGF